MFFLQRIYIVKKKPEVSSACGIPSKNTITLDRLTLLSYFSMKTYVVGTHQKHLGEVLLMTTHNICFHGEIRKKYQYFFTEKKRLIWSYVTNKNNIARNDPM